MALVLVAVPDRDFDTTEVAVPWRLLTDAGHTVVFATEHGGKAPATDPLLLSGVVFKMLGAAREAKKCYAELLQDEHFNNPISWSNLSPGEYDGLLLPGGHAKGMRQYLGSTDLQAKVVEYWATGKPIGAICHGVLVLARAIDPGTGRSVLHGRRTTCLPRSLEMSAYLSTFWRRGRYYRTYPTYVQREVRRALASRSDFSRGAPTFLVRGTRDRDRTAFVVEDGNYLSARWPGDAYLFARRFEALLAKQVDRSTNQRRDIQPASGAGGPSRWRPKSLRRTVRESAPEPDIATACQAVDERWSHAWTPALATVEPFVRERWSRSPPKLASPGPKFSSATSLPPPERSAPAPG